MDIRRLEQLARMGDEEALAELGRRYSRKGQYPHATTREVCAEQMIFLTHLFEDGRLSFVDYVESMFQICKAKSGQMLQLQRMEKDIPGEVKNLPRRISRGPFEGSFSAWSHPPGQGVGLYSLPLILYRAGAAFPYRMRQKREDVITMTFSVSKPKKGHVKLFAFNSKDHVFLNRYGGRRLSDPNYRTPYPKSLRPKLKTFGTSCDFPLFCFIRFYFNVLGPHDQLMPQFETQTDMRKYLRNLYEEGDELSEEIAPIPRSYGKFPSSHIRGGWALQPDGTWRKLGAR